MKLPKIFVPDKNLEKKTKELLTFKRKREFKHARFNTLKSSDEHVQYLYGLWCEQAFTSEDDKRDSVAEVYCVHFLGVSKDVFKDFKINNSIQAYDKIGQLQSGLLDRKNDFKSFWDEMSNIFPYDYTKEDLEFLVSNGEFPIFHLLNQFQTYAPTSLLEKLKRNAHVYK